MTTATVTTATPAMRLQAEYNVRPEHTASSLTDSREALMSWAGRDGRFSIEDVLAIVQGHGETLSAWGDACNEAARFQSVYDAQALLTWLGY